MDPREQVVEAARESLRKVLIHTALPPAPSVELLRGLLASCERNARAGLDALAAHDAAQAKAGEGRTFPIQSERGAAAHPTSIPWWLADRAYSVYRVKYGASQTLERIAERHGFAPSEMDEFVPGWRDMASTPPRAAYEAVAREAVRLAIDHGAPHTDAAQADIIARAVAKVLPKSGDEVGS